MKYYLAVLSLVVALVLWPQPFAYASNNTTTTASSSLPSKSLYNLSSQWQTQDGQTIDLASLRGQPVILAMAYTSCKDMCPLIVHNMMQIEDDLSSSPNTSIRFVFVSFDAEHDTPTQLKDFATHHEINLEHWTLLHGSTKNIQELAAVLGVRYRPKKDGGYDHSNVISLLDANGIVAYQQVGLQEDFHQIEDKAKTLLAH